MLHTRAHHPNRTITDPETGRVYPIPAGGSDGGAAVGDGGDAGDGGAGDGDGAGDGTGDGGDGDDGGEGGDDGPPAGSKEAVLADLARERQKRKEERDARKALEKRIAELESGNESEVDKAKREAREAALAPARAAIRRTAVETAAAALGFRDTSDAVRGVDLDAIDVDDETLEVDDRKAVDTIVAEFARSKPYLLTEDGQARLEGKSGAARGGADTASGNGGRRTTGTPQDSFMAALRSKAGRG